MTSGPWGLHDFAEAEPLSQPPGEGTQSDSGCLVRGQVRYVHGPPLRDAEVVAFHKDLRREFMLGRARTNDAGDFEIAYSAEDVPSESLDLLVRAYDADEALAESPVYFSAGRTVRVRLQVDGGPETTWSEYEQLMEKIEPLLDGVRMAELTESVDQQDVSLLAGKVAAPAERVATLVVAHKLAARTGLPAEFFYGLARENVPTNLSALLEAGPTIRREALEAAIRRRVIPSRLLDAVDGLDDRLRGVVTTTAGNARRHAAPVAAILATTLRRSADRQRFIEYYIEHDGASEDFWATIRADADLGPRAADLQLTIQLAALTDGHAPLIRTLRSRPGLRSIGQLAALSVDDWKATIRRIDGDDEQRVPADVQGGNLDERIELYAETLGRIVADALPGEVLAYHQAKSDPVPENVRTFWRNVTQTIDEASFDLEFGSTNLPDYLADYPALLGGVDDAEAVISHLQDVQRVFNLTTRPEEIALLMDSGVTSSADIARLGMDVFVQRFESYLGVDRLQRIFNKAQTVSAATMSIATQFGPQFNQLPTAVVAPPDATRVPALANLFGSFDTCKCERCRSVGGPAAYFTEILAFLKDRRSVLPGSGRGEANALDVLFGRRPDLGEIELTCENTNTPLPYIDLVIEVLERAVAPFVPFDISAARAAELDSRTISAELRTDFTNAGHALSDDHYAVAVHPDRQWFLTDRSVLYSISRRSADQLTVMSATYQTGAPADQLLANPEHVREPAYATLRNAVFPWSLPLDLWREEVVAYLGHLQVTRHELMVELTPGDGWSAPRRLDVATEYLGLNVKERQTIATPVGQPWSVYGLRQNGNRVEVFDPAEGTVVTQVLFWRHALSWVRVLLDRSQCSYEELATLLTTRFINPGGAVRIESADPADPTTCEIDKLQLTIVDGPFLDRLHRFVVAWRRLGWEPHELDLAIHVLQGDIGDVNDRLTSDFVIELSHVKRLAERLKLRVDEVLTFWGPISTFDSKPDEPDSLYVRLFQNPAVLNPVDPDFALVGDDPAVATTSDAKLSTHTATLLAAFGVAASELATLADHVVPGDVLDRASLSDLYRHVLLGRGLGLTVEDLLTLIEMSGIDPFSTATHDAVYLVELADRVAATGLSISETDYLLHHRSVDRIDWDPADETVATFLGELRTALRRVREDTELRPDPVGDATRAALASLQWPAELVNHVIETLTGTVTYRAALTALPPELAPPPDPTFPPSVGGRVAYATTARQMAVVGPLTTKQREDLRNMSADPAWRTALDDLFDQPRKFVADRMRAFEYPTFRADLAKLPSKAVFPEGLRSRIFYDTTTKQLCFVGVMTDTEKDTLDALSGVAAYRAAVQKLFAAPLAYVPDPANTFYAAGDVGELFDDDMTAAARFGLVLGRLLEHLRKTASESAVAQCVGEALGLGPAAAESLLASVVHADGKLAGPAMGDFLAEPFATSNPGIALTRKGFPAQYATYVRLLKAARLAEALRLPPEQLHWLGDFGSGVTARPIPWLPLAAGLNAGWLHIDALSVAEQQPDTERFAAWLRLVDTVHLRDALQGGFETLSSVLRMARDPATTRADVLDKIAERTGWDRYMTGYLSGPRGLDLARSDIADETGLVRLQRAARRVHRMGASPQQCRGFARPQPRAVDARAARQLVKAKYSDAEWREVAQPLRDTLRERQRQALVDYLVVRPNRAKGQTWRDSNGLYAHFLIDPEMTACAVTSRLKQAIGSVQQFVQRCLLNLEADVAADDATDVGWRDWKWMRSHPVFEANVKVFMHPENWIEPELRDDKSPFFSEAESELLQNDVTADVAEDIFMTYLERLDSVARLEIAGMYLEAAADGQPEVLHVFGRTYGSTTPSYYYRQRVNGRWTAWETVDLDISERQILPIVWNRRLYLFWPVFTERGETPAPSSAPNLTPPVRYFDLQLAWSEHKRGAWQPKRVTRDTVRLPINPDTAAERAKGKYLLRAGIDGLSHLLVSYEYDDPSESFISAGFGFVPGETRYAEGWKFTGGDGRTEPWNRIMRGVYQPTGTVVDGMSFVEDGSQPLRVPKVLTSGEEVALTVTPGQFGLMYLHQDRYITGLRPFFYVDDTRTYLVESVEEWGPASSSSWIDDLALVDKVRRMYYTPVLIRDGGVIDPVDPIARWGVMDPVPIARKVIDDAGNHIARVGAADPMAPAPGAGLMPMLDLRSTRAHFWGEPAEEDAAGNGNPPAELVIAKGDRATYTIGEFISDARLHEWTYLLPTAQRMRRYQFTNFFHPYVGPFMKRLNMNGVGGLLERSGQLEPPLQTFGPAYQPFELRYQPTDAVAKGDPVKLDKYPVDDVDFNFGGAYALYNWELFFHLPLLIATRLMQNQRFEEARRWFHFIFDPTDTSNANSPQRFWQTKPFFEASQPDILKQRIERIIAELADGTVDPELQRQVDEWRRNPFKPHAIARLRTTAYQKNVVMRYLDNLIAWGDQQFRRFTIESINEAAQLYILAAEILGRRPTIIEPRARPQVHTFNALDPSTSGFPAELADIEYLFGSLRPDSVVTDPNSPPLPLPRMLYFCVPPNDKLLDYWNTVADRLSKIRHCKNIEGLAGQPALWEPAIDPALLVRATAAGVDIAAALSDAAAPLPTYRFRPLAAKAKELTAEVKALGAALHAALDSRDSDKLALLRASNEIAVQVTAEQVRVEQLKEAEQQVATLRQARVQGVTRYLHAQRLLGVQNPQAPAEGANIPDASAAASFQIKSTDGAKLIQQEANELAKLTSARANEHTAAGYELAASIAHQVPVIQMDAKPWWIGPGVSYGGLAVGAGLSAIGNRWRDAASADTSNATRSAKLGGYVLREQDWVLQNNLAAKEIMHIDTQIVAALIRQQVADRELASHRKRMDLSKAELDLMTRRFSNDQLRGWMIGKISEVYFQTYRLAYDVAQRAEGAYRFELGLADSNFIHFGYWDSLKKGLLAGEQLQLDLQRIEVSYLDLNRREHEQTKHISLNMLHPGALVELRETGSCRVEIPEAIFDLDCPGHYMRRIRSVSWTIPCTTGPYTNVSCKITQLANRVRRNPDTDTKSKDPYGWRGMDDTRFVHDSGGIDSIVTSTGREDSGLFQLDFHDDRYLPFEGRGAVSAWRLELPTQFRQFDYDTISDVIFHMRYTARDGGTDLRNAATRTLTTALKKMQLEEDTNGLYRLFMARSEFPEAFDGLLHPHPDATSQTLSVRLGKQRFPFYVRDRTIRITSLTVFLELADGVAYDNQDPLEVTVRRPTGATTDLTLTSKPGIAGGLPSGQVAIAQPGSPLSEAKDWQILVKTVPPALRTTVEVGSLDVHRLKAEVTQDVGLLCTYSI